MHINITKVLHVCFTIVIILFAAGAMCDFIDAVLYTRDYMPAIAQTAIGILLVQLERHWL